MQPAIRISTAAILAVLWTGVAAAQSPPTWGVGLGASAVLPTSDELSTAPRVRPSLRRVPSRGWGMAFALNWFDADVDARSVQREGPLGRLSIRPLMIGVGYTAVRNRLSISPSVVAGPSLNSLTLDDRWAGVLDVGAGGLEERVGAISVAVRPGLGVGVSLAPRLALTGFGGYLVNRPTITLRTPEGESRRAWRTDGVVLNGGFAVLLF